MLTPGYSLTSTERVLPRLALDFTTASLDSRVTLTRALNTATVINSSGQIAPINADLPRFDYNLGTGGACRGLLIEEARTNILVNSSLGGVVAGSPGTAPTSWIIQFGTGATSALATSIYGTLDGAQAITFSGTSIRMMYAQTINVTAGQQYAFSAYLEFVSSNIGEFMTVTNGTATVTVNATVVNPQTPGRYTVLFTASTTGTCTARIGIGTTGGTAGAVSVTFSRPQIEAGAFATSYIPTTTTSLTRNADVVTMTGTNFSDWWQATTGSVAARAVPTTVNGVRPLVQFDDNTADNIIALQGNTTNPELYIKATTDQAQIDAGTISANTIYMLASAWNTDNCAAAVNGGGVATDTSATIPTVTQARLGNNGTNYLNGRLQTVRFWPQRITDAEIRAFSKL
jgi:hypothetical protein